MILTIYTKYKNDYLIKQCEIKFKFLLTAARARRFRFTKQDLYCFEVLSTKTHTHTHITLKVVHDCFVKSKLKYQEKRKSNNGMNFDLLLATYFDLFNMAGNVIRDLIFLISII